MWDFIGSAVCHVHVHVCSATKGVGQGQSPGREEEGVGGRVRMGRMGWRIVSGEKEEEEEEEEQRKYGV